MSAAPPVYTLSPIVVELLDRAAAAALRSPRPGSLFDDFDRDELLGLAAAMLAEVARRDRRRIVAGDGGEGSPQ